MHAAMGIYFRCVHFTTITPTCLIAQRLRHFPVHSATKHFFFGKCHFARTFDFRSAVDFTNKTALSTPSVSGLGKASAQVLHSLLNATRRDQLHLYLVQDYVLRLPLVAAG